MLEIVVLLCLCYFCINMVHGDDALDLVKEVLKELGERADLRCFVRRAHPFIQAVMTTLPVV